MENNKIESLLVQILENQTKMQSDITGMQFDITGIQSDITGMKSDITEIKGKINSVYDQTADLTEFRTETKDNFSSINKDVKFIKHKLHETEEDVFDIKDHLKIVK
ncbi:hypothetical protein psyc5s11_17820 [Clostridium gelidum]|uniref:Uncharacterized protein n=1 Tax=Clostridium gelidum TaxID=704125 RepID=A0ABM7T1C4_9CLOT|nr:hypothetical protein [Clostridium gelidum]BCZ45715.1 hypothetical protein psyc5s11_17820 [Clostridium gelidum]